MLKNQFMEFTKTRYLNSNAEIIDLKVCDLREIVFYFYKEKLMDDKVFRKFELSYKEDMERNFIEFLRMME